MHHLRHVRWDPRSVDAFGPHPGASIEVKTLKYTNGDVYEVQTTSKSDPTCTPVISNPCPALTCHHTANGLVMPLSTKQGEAVGDLRHGRGTQTCSNGDTYKGAWRYDKREGTGVAEFVRGAQYDGEWKDDKAHGCAGGLSSCARSRKWLPRTCWCTVCTVDKDWPGYGKPHCCFARTFRLLQSAFLRGAALPAAPA